MIIPRHAICNTSDELDLASSYSRDTKRPKMRLSARFHDHDEGFGSKALSRLKHGGERSGVGQQVCHRPLDAGTRSEEVHRQRAQSARADDDTEVMSGNIRVGHGEIYAGVAAELTV